MEAFVEAATTAARVGGETLKATWRRDKQIEIKSGPVDIVTNVDRVVERGIMELLRSRFPEHGIVAEESPQERTASPYCWYVDPIDGTTNFAHGYPHFAVSVALAHEGVPVVGVVYDPLREETFCARRGGGATLNDAPLHVSTVSGLEQSLLLTGFPYDRRERSAFYLRFYEAFMCRAQGVRRSGSAALDLCYVAAGRAEGFWEWRLQPWDTAAGVLMVEEAGGGVSDFCGARFELLGEQTLASNGLIHAGMIGVVRDVLART